MLPVSIGEHLARFWVGVNFAYSPLLTLA